MEFLIKFFLQILIYVWASCLTGQSLYYTIKNGLPSNNVYSVKQDKKGFIWATTDKGVVRYDGRSFKLYTVDQGLASNDNFAMVIDSKDNVWLYSFKAISKIEPSGVCKIFGDTKSYFSHFYLNSKDEIFYSLVDNSKIKHFIIQDSEIKELELPTSHSVGSLGILYKDNYLVLCTDKKVKSKDFCELNSNHNNFKNQRQFEIPKAFFVSDDPTFEVLNINDVYYTLNKKSYHINKSPKTISKIDGIIDYPENLKKVSRGNNFIRDSVIYIVFNKGIYTFNIDKDVWSPFLYEPKATSIVIDQEKNVWLSTMGDGIVKYSNLDLKTGQNLIEIISNEPVKKVTGFKNKSLWTSNSKNDVKELVSSKLYYQPDLIDLRFLEVDNYGDVYFGGSNAVLRNGVVFSEFGFKAIDVFKDSIALSTTFGTNFLNRNSLNSLRNFDNSQRTDLSGRMYAILLLDGKFYSGNQKGLFWGKTTANALYPICLDDDIESVSINGIKRSKDGLVWVATEGNGIYILKDDVVIRHINSELLDANIHALKIDEKDRVWVATRKGVNMIRKTSTDFMVDKYTSFHGLPDDYINDIYCYDELLYVATDEGLVQLNLAEINKMNFKLPPPIYINTFRILKSDWQNVIQDSLHLFEHNENTVNFEYSGISYKSNGTIRFEYRLLPAVTSWLQTTNDNITFNNLKPDQYTFEVRAIDAIGNVSIQPARISFVIKKHFTDELWFAILIWLGAFIIVLLATLKYFRYRRSLTEEANRVEKLISELRLKSLQAQLNPHFIFNSLNAIQQFINTENKKSANDYLSKFARLMRLYLNGSDTQFISLAQELEVLKLYCNLEHLRFADKFQYSIEIQDGIPLEMYRVPAMLLQPYVENAIRHGLIPANKDDNFLLIQVKSVENGVLCLIEDNGIGRKRSLELKKTRATDHKSMGSKISKERLEMIRSLKIGNITEEIEDIVDNDGNVKGTVVKILLLNIISVSLSD